MAVRGAALGITGIQGVNPLGIMISALTGFLRRESRVGFRQVVDLVQEITFTQMRI
jgi:hypothetical protein